MFLSKLCVNSDYQPGRLWLKNRYHIHQRLCMAFPSAHRKENDPAFLKPFNPDDFSAEHARVERDEHAGFLFRIDAQPGGRVAVLVQSAVAPDWEYAFHNAMMLLAAPPVSRFHESTFEAGQRLRFRLEANPTRKIDTKSGSDGTRRHGRRVPVRDEHLMDWLVSRAANTGFAPDEKNTTIVPGYANFEKRSNGGEKCRLRTARYDGILTVTDPALFAETLVRGIGPAKAYGFGMLSVAP